MKPISVLLLAAFLATACAPYHTHTTPSPEVVVVAEPVTMTYIGLSMYDSWSFYYGYYNYYDPFYYNRPYYHYYWRDPYWYMPHYYTYYGGGYYNRSYYGLPQYTPSPTRYTFKQPAARPNPLPMRQRPDNVNNRARKVAPVPNRSMPESRGFTSAPTPNRATPAPRSCSGTS